MNAVTVKDAARMVGTSGEVVRKAIRSGVLAAVPRGLGARSGYLVNIASLQRWALSKGRLLGSRLPAEGESTEAAFVESGQFLPFDEQFLPTLPLPDLIRYAETLQVLTKAVLAEARRKLSEEVLVE